MFVARPKAASHKRSSRHYYHRGVVMASAQMHAHAVAGGACAPQASRRSIPALSGRASGFAGGRTLHQSSPASSRSRCQLQIVRAIAAPPAPSLNSSEPAAFKAWENVTSSVKKRTDIKTIMLLGAGPIVIGQVTLQLSRPSPIKPYGTASGRSSRRGPSSVL